MNNSAMNIMYKILCRWVFLLLVGVFLGAYAQCFEKLPD